MKKKNNGEEKKITVRRKSKENNFSSVVIFHCIFSVHKTVILVSHTSQAVVAHTFNPTIWEAEADGSLNDHDHPGLHKINAETDPGGDVHTFNPTMRESHAFNPSPRGEYKKGGNKGSGLSL